MTRAHLPLHLAAVFVAAVSLVGAACNSDDLEQLTGTTGGSTEVDPTEVPTFTTGEPVDSTSTTMVPPSPKSCRDAIGCALMCALQIPSPTPPEYDWQSCFFTNCLEELTTAEWLKLFDLGECVVEKCSATPECMSGAEECNSCYLSSLGNQNPPAGDVCEAQAKACK